MKKNSASVPQSGVEEYCLVKFWLKWMMDGVKILIFLKLKDCITIFWSIFGNSMLLSLNFWSYVSENPEKWGKRKICYGTTFSLISNSSHKDLIWLCFMALSIGYMLLCEEMYSLTPPKINLVNLSNLILPFENFVTKNSETPKTLGILIDKFMKNIKITSLNSSAYP